jgi:hypothetical protein
MTDPEAKAIISSYGAPANIAEHIEAIRVALRVLGEDATMEDVWRWAKQPEKEVNEC